jgi:DNA-binding NtrC family response regulator
MVVMARATCWAWSDVPAELRDGAAPAVVSNPSVPLQDLEAIERSHILASLEAHSGNRTHAAAALRISVRTLQRKLKAWGLETYLHRDSGETVPTEPTS